jgi:hypothetical protein
MINISDDLKQIYKNDFFPYADAVTPKELVIYFPDLDLTIRTVQIVDDSFSLEESLCSDEDITLGSCESSKIKFTVADVAEDLTGYSFTISQVIDGYDPVPLGTYKVDSCKKQADLRFKDIVAYDAIKDTDVDVSGWYNSLTFPITKKEMLHSLLTYLKIDYEEQDLPNDGELIEKTINPSYLKGRDVLISLCAISGGFGHVSRLNKFKVILLSGLGLFPSESLYPAEDLFPSESNEFLSAGYMESNYEEYIVEPITGIRISQDNEDIGVTVGTTDNVYTITGNFLLYGKNAEELQRIAQNILLVVKNKYYRPHTTKMVGLPYIEVGDAISIITTNDVIETFVFKRTLSGVQVLIDEISATGNKKLENNIGPSTEIQQLKSKTLKIEKNIDQLSIDMIDMGSGLMNQIAITAGQLQTQITDNQNFVNSQITQMANSINLKVSKGDISSELSMESGQITLKSNRLVVESDQFTLDASGKAWFGGAISWGDGNSITNDSNGNTYLDASELLWLRAPDIALGTNNVLVVDNNSKNVLIDKLNGGVPITSSNKSSYTFPPASHTHTFATLYNNNGIAHVTSYEYNFRPHSAMGDNEISCGSPSYRWTQVFAATPTISTSDGNLKELAGEVTDAEKRVARKIKSLITKFRYKDAIAKKGNDARIHFGVVAQDVKEAFESEGLNPYQYGLFCSDTWYEKDGKACDENDRPYTKYDEGVTEVTRLSLRNEELHYFILKSLD